MHTRPDLRRRTRGRLGQLVDQQIQVTHAAHQEPLRPLHRERGTLEPECGDPRRCQRIDRDAGKEEFHRPGERPFALQRNDPVLYFIQRLRDEAHRWAIGAHRAKRAKAVSLTPLDDIPGIGATRKRALLQHFGSAKAVARAGLSDLQAVDGISEAMAKTIADYFSAKG